MPRSCKALVAVAAVALALASCGSDAGDEASAPTTPTGCTAEGEITVAAAASLTEAFTTIGDLVEADCPGSTVDITFDSSGKLSEQILSGAPVDAFASADESNMEKVADQREGEPQVFARNRLVIVTEPGNPTGIASLADLADAGTVALCAEGAPCGRFAAQALEAAGVEIDESHVTRGANAKGTLTAVTEGDAVAGIVYVTDAQAAGDAADTVEIPDDQNVIATYPIATIDGPGDDDLAEAFVAAVLGEEGQRALAAAGFLPAT